MPEALELTPDEALNPFSAEGFAARARLRGLALDKAAWMAAQPASYGIDAGHRLDEEGNANENLRLEDPVAPGAWKMAAVLVPVVAREPEATVVLILRTSHLSAHSGRIAFPGGKIEESDATPVEAALREAHEEIGLSPELVTPLSLLDLHNTGTGYRIIPVAFARRSVVHAGSGPGRSRGCVRGAAVLPHGRGKSHEASA